MNQITIPFLVDGAELAEIRLQRTATGCDNTDTYHWEWGIFNPWGYEVIDQGQIQHQEHLGLFSLFHRILGIVLGVKNAAIGR